MKVYLNKVSGYASAITTMYQSKRSWTRQLEADIYEMENVATTREGKILESVGEERAFLKELEKVCKWGKKHITLLRFIDIEFSVEGLHRGGQDDFDSHAKRLENRIVRSSTRLAEFGNEKSDYYKDKILTLDEACEVLHKNFPKTLCKDGATYVKTLNGYIREDLADDKDVKRGLYMLSIPSNFTAKCNIAELAHIIKMRDKYSTANPEVQQLIESLLEQLEATCPLFTRKFFYEIDN